MGKTKVQGDMCDDMIMKFNTNIIREEIADAWWPILGKYLTTESHLILLDWETRQSCEWRVGQRTFDEIRKGTRQKNVVKHT